MLHMKMQLHATVFCYTRVRRKYTDVSLSRDGSKLDFIIRLCRRSFFFATFSQPRDRNDR